MGTIRWNERLRSKDPAVWIHWVGKDPVEMSTSLPSPDSDGLIILLNPHAKLSLGFITHKPAHV